MRCKDFNEMGFPQRSERTMLRIMRHVKLVDIKKINDPIYISGIKKNKTQSANDNSARRCRQVAKMDKSDVERRGPGLKNTRKMVNKEHLAEDGMKAWRKQTVANNQA